MLPVLRILSTAGRGWEYARSDAKRPRSRCVHRATLWLYFARGLIPSGRPQLLPQVPMADVFISYAREDAEVAGRFAEAFQAAGFSVWWDDALRSGEAFDESIERALREAKAVVVSGRQVP